MKKFLVATSALACLLAAPLAAQAATSSSTGYETPQPAKHATVRHHTAKQEKTKHHMAMNKHKANCPPGSQSAACSPSSTGSTK